MVAMQQILHLYANAIQNNRLTGHLIPADHLVNLLSDAIRNDLVQNIKVLFLVNYSLS